jgi:hypothetical protein
MSRQTGVDGQEVQQDKSADSGKALENPQPRRHKTERNESIHFMDVRQVRGLNIDDAALTAKYFLRSVRMFPLV